MLYFDITYLYRVYSTEPGHEAVRGLLSKTAKLATAWHGRAEFASILLRKRREGNDSPAQLEDLGAQFRNDFQTGPIELLPLTEAVITRLENVLAAAPATTNIRLPKRAEPTINAMPLMVVALFLFSSYIKPICQLNETESIKPSTKNFFCSVWLSCIRDLYHVTRNSF